MNDFWIAVVVSLLAGLSFIWWSVSAQLGNETEQKLNSGSSKNSLWLFSPIVLMFLLAPIGYYYLGSAEKQVEWGNINQRFADIQRGVKFDSDTETIQNMVLALRTSIDQEPDNGQLWFMLAESYFQLRMVDLADASIQRALRLQQNPDWYVANAQILSVRSTDADIAKSILLLKNALAIQPSHQAALLTLGFVYLRQKNFEQAIFYWQRLMSILKVSGNDTSAIMKQIEFAQQQMQLNSQKD